MAPQAGEGGVSPAHNFHHKQNWTIGSVCSSGISHSLKFQVLLKMSSGMFLRLFFPTLSIDLRVTVSVWDSSGAGDAHVQVSAVWGSPHHTQPSRSKPLHLASMAFHTWGWRLPHSGKGADPGFFMDREWWSCWNQWKHTLRAWELGRLCPKSSNRSDPIRVSGFGPFPETSSFWKDL